jgi:NADH-quinone oxidoreductase subunit H
MIAVFPAFVTFAVVPFGDTLCAKWGPPDSFLSALRGFHIAATVPRSGVCAEGGVPLQLIDLNVGLLYMFALAGTGIIGAAIAGWSSDNKYSLMGGLRAASQMVSYEVGMGLSLVGAMMLYGSVRLDDMVRWQGEHAWGIFLMPAAFFLFLATSIAEQKRTPFDAPEGESEIVAGYFLEYSGMKFSMFMLGEYIEVVVSSAILVTIFFGGYGLPFLHRDGITVAFGGNTLYHLTMTHGSVILIGALVFFGKTILTCFLQLFIRWTVPRFRYDQIMKLGWRILLPASLANMLLTGVVILAVDRGGVAISNALDVAAEICQAVVVLVGAAVAVWFVLLLVRPVHRTKKIVSSSAKYAEAQGGVKATPMQA